MYYNTCNTGDAPATNINAAFVWDTTDTYINLRAGSYGTPGNSYPTIASLAAGSCKDVYFEVTITRNASAYNHTARYHITVSADGLTAISSPIPREIFVEHLISQNRNATTDVKLDGVSIPAGGSMTLLVGNTYNIQLVGNTATNGYEQIESFINLPNTIFRINSIATTYSAYPTPQTDSLYNLKMYADGCGWVNNPLSPNYRSCTGVGKYGGNVTVTYNVTILSGGGSAQTLNTLIYDFSGSSYHYNSDFGVGARVANIVDTASAGVTKSFSPAAINLGGVSRLTITINNYNATAVSGYSLTDPLPTNMKVASSPSANTSGCGSPTFAPAANDVSLSFSNGVIAANGSCTIQVNVTTTATGSFTNTTNHLYVNGQDTGKYAAATLTVNSAAPAPTETCGIEMAIWEFTSSLNPTFQSNAVTSASASYDPTGSTGLLSNVPATVNGRTGVWSVQSNGSGSKWPASASTSASPYIVFSVDASNFSNVSIIFDVDLETGGTWGSAADNHIYVWSNASDVNSGAFDATARLNLTNITTGQWNVGNVAYASTTASAAGRIISFRINESGAKTTGQMPSINLDNVKIVGCRALTPPTITKAFSPDPVAVGSNSTLNFTITNPNNGPSATLTGIDFYDFLPLTTLQGTVAVTNGSAAVVGTGSAFKTQLTTGSIVVIPGSPVALSGTVAVTNGSYYVTGANAQFTTELVAGSRIIINSASYVVTEIINANSLVLANDYTGSTASGLTASTYQRYTVSSIASDTALTLTSTYAGTTSTSATIGAGLTLASSPTTSCRGTATGLAGTASIALSGDRLKGLLSVTNSSASVSGAGTAFLSQLKAGSRIAINSVFYEVSSIASDTSMTLKTIYAGTTASNLIYTYYTTPLQGTVTVTDKTASVSGSGTSFTTQLVAGDIIYIKSVRYTVQSIASNTSLTLSSVYNGTGNGASESGLTIGANFILEGAAATTAGSASVVGTGTLFKTELYAGEVVYFSGTPYTIASITDDTHLTLTGNAAATASSLEISKEGRTGLAGGGASTCTVSASVKASTPGARTNVSENILSIESGVNTTSNGFATATLTAIQPPSIVKAFGDSTILVSNTTPLIFTISNPNATTSLTGVQFSDTLPGGLVVASPNGLLGSCGGGTISADATSSTISLSGATLAANSSCSFRVNVTASTADTKLNSTTVSSTNGGTGNTTSATLYVKNVTPSISIKKQISASVSGPWSESLILAAGSNVYYQFTVENTGDVELNPVSITDDRVSMTDCNTALAAAGALPVAAAANENHIRSCVVGPVTATAGNVKNTATAHGTYSGTVYNSNTDSATYQNGNFGHLPSAYSNMNLYNDGGAFSLNGMTYLGASATTDATDGINTVTYTPKTTDNGVAWTGSWNAGTGHATVNVTCPSAPCYLYAWADWNKDNDFNDLNEAIYAGAVVNGSNSINFTYADSGALAAGTYYTRFRVYAQQPGSPQPDGAALTSGGVAITGEIEDPFIYSDGGGGTPTPVTLSYFVAQRQGDRVSFNWSTASETGNVGFNLYVMEGEQMRRINEQLIASYKTDSLERQDYSYAAAVSGNEFYIEDVDVLGEARRHGPFRVGEAYGTRIADNKIDLAGIWKEHAGKLAVQQKSEASW